MVKLKGKLKKDYDPDEGGLNYEQPKPGVYNAKIHSVDEDESAAGNDMMVVVYEIADNDYKGSRLWDYITFTESQEWKLEQFLFAVGIDPGSDYSLDGDDLVGTLVKMRVRADSYNGEYRARPGQVSRHPDSTAARPGGKKVAVEVEPEPSETEGDEDWPTPDEVSAMSVAELRELADELELGDVSGKRKPTLVKLINEEIEQLAF